MAEGLLLRIAVIEKNERNQEVELVRKTMQFEPQVRLTFLHFLRNVSKHFQFLTIHVKKP